MNAALSSVLSESSCFPDLPRYTIAIHFLGSEDTDSPSAVVPAFCCPLLRTAKAKDMYFRASRSVYALLKNPSRVFGVSVLVGITACSRALVIAFLFRAALALAVVASPSLAVSSNRLSTASVATTSSIDSAAGLTRSGAGAGPSESGKNPSPETSPVVGGRAPRRRAACSLAAMSASALYVPAIIGAPPTAVPPIAPLSPASPAP